MEWRGSSACFLWASLISSSNKVEVGELPFEEATTINMFDDLEDPILSQIYGTTFSQEVHTLGPIHALISRDRARNLSLGWQNSLMEHNPKEELDFGRHVNLPNQT
ncbi:hypothetical protein AQUCO_00800062v1 [Aquilegia coerulea]|uniref:Uncharacterized protein n=1 Tax=Aquilegia coerulea TaxID=218851 RepID=A0A2G5EHL5_AQUCA|nr:hypothetical protein AQUCO_00800062v1 [Aquilegia coerulea]